MKRALAALVMLGIATVTAAPSMAATTVYGSAQIKYTVNAVTLVSIATNYATASPYGQSSSAATILPSTAGNCAAGAVETTATLTFGGVTPPSTAGAYTGCYYKNAVEIGVNSNDGNGYKVYEYLDTAVTGTAICLYPTNTTPAATPPASGVTATNPAAYTGSACVTPTGGVAGTPLTYTGAVAGSSFGAASNPGTGTWDVVASPSAGTTLSSAAVVTAGALTGWNYLGQDLQLNVAQNAVAQADTNVLTVAVVPQ